MTPWCFRPMLWLRFCALGRWLRWRCTGRSMLYCQCEGCFEVIPEWWATWMCWDCAHEECQHQDPGEP